MVRAPGHRGADDGGGDLDSGGGGADLVLDDDDGDGGCFVVAQPRPPTVLALCLKSSHEV